MTQITRTLGLLCVVLVVGALKPAAQSMSVQAEMLTDWTSLKERMNKMANEMPEDQFGYKSTPAQRDYGQQILHIARVNGRFLSTVGANATAPTMPDDTNTTGKAAIIRAMDDSFDYGIAILKEQTDQTMLQGAANPPRFMGPSTRARIFTFLIGHTWDIYGQMAVYLRLNGLVPPASQPA